jgi:hypothetical protein
MRTWQAHGVAAARQVALIGLVLATGCAERMAKNMSAGIIQQQANAPESEQISRIMSSRVVEGAVDTLDSPEQRQKIQRIVNAAVAEAVASALRVALAPGAVGRVGDGGGRGAAAVLAGQIGRAATEDALGRVAVELGSAGALSQGIVATGAKATNAAVGAALGEFFPECRGDDAAAAACRRVRMQALTRATAASVSAGVRDSFAWPLLLLAIAIGLTLGALAHWAVTLRRRRPHALRHA